MEIVPIDKDQDEWKVVSTETGRPIFFGTESECKRFFFQERERIRASRGLGKYGLR